MSARSCAEPSAPQSQEAGRPASTGTSQTTAGARENAPVLDPLTALDRELTATESAGPRFTVARRGEVPPAAPISSETWLQLGFAGSPIGMALIEPTAGRYLRVNDALCRLLGRDRAELLLQTHADVSLAEDRRRDAAARRAMLAGDITHIDAEKRYVRGDGELIWASVHIVPVIGTDGAIRALFAQVMDLTVQKQAEARRRQAAADAEGLAEIRAALREGRMEVHAQPIVDVASGETVQQELLVRMRGRDGTLVPPGAFLPLAERHGLITEIDRWMTERAVELAADGRPVEVNLSAASVGDPELLATIRAALTRTGADPRLIIFEVTETALMADLVAGRAFAVALRELGCRFALDDFGTGYGTFTYLKHIPIDSLKIDIEFVRELHANPEDQRLVRGIVNLARLLGKETVAEGVEDPATFAHLKAIGVDHAQGYLFGRPAPVAGLGGLGAPPAARARAREDALTAAA